MTQAPKQRWPTVPLAASPRKRLYAAERRFDLITLLTIMTAYAVLFGVMRFFRWGIGTFAVVAGLVTFVGVGQALLFQGDAPRRASAMVGAVYLVSVAVIAGMAEGELIETVLCMLVSVSIEGALAGYISGVLVGGVFMVAESLGHRFARIGRKNIREAATVIEDSMANSDD